MGQEVRSDRLRLNGPMEPGLIEPDPIVNGSLVVIIPDSYELKKIPGKSVAV